MQHRLAAFAKHAAAALLASTVLAGAAQAGVVVDGSPTGSYYGSWSNASYGQNFLVKFTLASATDITGFDIFTSSPSAEVGRGVTVKIRNDVAGNPAVTNLYEFIDSIDSELAHSGSVDISSVNFNAITLAAGSYWMGVSGNTSDISWSSFNRGSAAQAEQRQLSGNTIQFAPSIQNLAYRIQGSAANAVPEPTSLALVGLALVGIGASRRRR